MQKRKRTRRRPNRRSKARPALCAAVAAGDFRQVKRLLDAGADVHERDQDGYQPIHRADSRDADPHSQLEILKLLLAHGADPNATIRCFGVDNTNLANRPLNDAAHEASVEFIQLLLDHGADINAVSYFGPPISHAMYGNNVPVIGRLLRRGADPNIPDCDGNSPLHLAASFGQLKVVRWLLAHGGNVNAPNKEGRQPLDGAFARGYYDIASLLQDHEATWTIDPNTRPQWLRRQLARDFLRSKQRERRHR